jgi:hypothetical protein
MPQLIQDAVASEAAEVERRRAARRRAGSRHKQGSSRVWESAEERRQAKRLAGSSGLNSGASGNRVTGGLRVAGWPESQSCECEQSHGEAGVAGSVVGTPQQKTSSAAFGFCEPNLSSET